MVPDVNQIQLSPYATRDASRAYHAAHGIVTESWSPVGAADASLRSDPTVRAIAGRLGRSPAQVVLRWHVQLGQVAIPKSADPGRMAENLDVFDFELSAGDPAELSALDRGEAVVTDADRFGH